MKAINNRMKKLISLCLLLFIVISILPGCTGLKDNTNEIHQLSKLSVKTEPNSMDLQFYYKLFGEKFDSFQDALDDLVNNYNETQNNEVLLKLCRALTYKYIDNCDDKVIEYYEEFFNKIWRNKSFYKETSDYRKGYADDLLSCLYFKGKLNESIEFYDKYVSYVKDKDELVDITYLYSLHYFYDTDADHDAMAIMLDRVKTIESKYYDKVADYNKFSILVMISKYSYKLNDEKTGKEYDKKAKDLITEMELDAD